MGAIAQPGGCVVNAARLNLLLRIRRLRERDALRALAERQRAQSHAEFRLESTMPALAGAGLQSSTDLAGFHSLIAFRTALSTQVDDLQEAVVATRAGAEECRAGWFLADRDREISQRLADRHAEVERAASDHREVRDSDDLSVARHVAAQAQSAAPEEGR